MIQEFSGFENTIFVALFATQAHPVGLLSSEPAFWPYPEMVDESTGFIPLISHVVFVLVFTEHHPRQVWLEKGRWELPLGYTGWDMRVVITLNSLTMQSDDSASSLTFPGLLQPVILGAPFLGCVHWYQTVAFFCCEICLGCTPALTLYDLGSCGPKWSCGRPAESGVGKVKGSR